MIRKIFVYSILLCLLALSIVVVARAQRGYDSAMEDRLKKERSENTYWERKAKYKDRLLLEDLEDQIKHRKWKREQERSSKNKSNKRSKKK